MPRFMRMATLIASVIGIVVGTASAQDYPNRPVTLIVPFAPGGATDIVARQLAPGLSAALGQNVIIENVSGGGASIGPTRVARAAPDGYTLLIHNLAISAMGSLNPNLQFSAEKDLAPIGSVNSNPIVLLGRNGIPAETLPELLAWMKTSRARIAHVGIGSTAHLAAALFGQAAGAEIDHIPYRGANPAVQDIVAGHVDLFFTTPPSVIGPINAKQAKGYGFSAKGRLAKLPGVPSLVEALGPKMEFTFWHIMFAPTGTPKPIIDKLNAALQAAIDDPKVKGMWAESEVSAFPPGERSPEASAAFMRSEMARWAAVIRDNKIEAPQQ